MGMGTGKSKIIVDNAAYLFENGEIDWLIVVAPNSVHQKWLDTEFPKHLPDRIESIQWEIKKFYKQLTKEKKLDFHEGTLKILCINVDVFSSVRYYELIDKILSRQKVMFVLDESSRIKNPGTKRTKSLIKLAKKAKYKRILTGTAVTQNPLDLWAQFEFLDPSIIGQKSFYTFKCRYAEFKVETMRGRPFHKVVGFKNMDELSRLIAPYSDIVKKEDCMDLPDKIYSVIPVEMAPSQKKIYKDMASSLKAEIEGQEMTAQIVLTKLLRLQQITGGFFVPDEEKPQKISDKSPKLSALMEIIQDLPSTVKVIIWSRFTHEINHIAEYLTGADIGRCVKFHGETSQSERKQHLIDFAKDPETRFFIGNQRAGGIGLDLVSASVVVYYSNNFSLEDRLQSEDRAHRIGQVNKVTYYDLVCKGTVDEHVQRTLASKDNIASCMMNQIKEWI